MTPDANISGIMSKKIRQGPCGAKDRVMSAGASKFLPKTTTSPVRLSEDVKNLLKASQKAKKTA